MNSPFAHLLDTNHVPDDRERDAINTFLSDPLIELLRLDDEIAKYNGLLAKREELSQIISSHRALLSPARRLPPELVKEIFLFCLPEQRKAAMSSSEAPVLLGRICSAWRHISLTTPQLWSSIHIVVPNHRDKTRRRAQGVQTWLAQAGLLPLSISIIDSNGPEDQNRDATLLVKCLIPFSRRWNQIDLRLPQSAFEAIATILPEEIPLLESISIQSSLVVRSSVTRGKMRILQGPLLRSVSFRHFLADPRMLVVNWYQLTDLHLEAGDPWASELRISTRTALDILALCPKLVSCILLVHSCWPDPFTPPPVPIILPDLQTIQVLETYEVHLHEFFDHIIAPRLCDIDIPGTKSPSQLHFHVPFISFLQSHPHDIRTLRLGTASLSPEALVECLRITPSLTHLVLNADNRQEWGNHQNPLNDGLLSCLTPTQDNQLDYLCPNLQHLEISHGHISDKALLTLIQERAKFEHKGTAKLGRVDATVFRELKIDLLAELQPLRDAGLTISLHYRSSVRRTAFDSPWHGLQVEDSATEVPELESVY